MTPYEVLNVGPKAKPAEITAAYRVLAQIFHPDRFAGAPDAVQKEAARRMSEVNEAYDFFRNGSKGESSIARERAARAAAGVPWQDQVRQRVAAEARAKEVRRAQEQAAPNGQAIPRPRTGGRKLALAGMGEALHTNKVRCRDCKSIQWLPNGWVDQLDFVDFYCSICSRLILAR
ncbi:MAG: J domain-containing protein [Actinomycetota bacterium]|nr:J domain-containing protein [Actinomycetota bacterium]